MSADQAPASQSMRLQVDYRDIEVAQALADPRTLAVFGFGSAVPLHADPRYLRVALQPHGAAPLEVWTAGNVVAHGRDGDVAWAEDGALQFGAMEIDESSIGGADALGAAAERAYARLLEVTAARGYPHLLRVWNYFDAITAGDGDSERYKRFCLGRGRGLGARVDAPLPAATAIGRPDGSSPALQVYWLASRVPGTPLENPRQLSAYRYPRQYGPQPPSFARAMLAPGALPLLISGTASIVGHESQHADCVQAQIDETFANFDSLIAAARMQRPALPPQFDASSRLKVYVRDRESMPAVAAALDARLGPDVPRILLHAAVCRRELRIEIDGVHG